MSYSHFPQTFPQRYVNTVFTQILHFFTSSPLLRTLRHFVLQSSIILQESWCISRVNVYLRQVVHDLLESGELPPQDKRYSIYGKSTVGSFKFCFLHKSVPTKAELSVIDEFILNTKYTIRKLAGSRSKWYGLDTSSLIIETVPLFISSSSLDNERVQRADNSEIFT